MKTLKAIGEAIAAVTFWIGLFMLSEKYYEATVWILGVATMAFIILGIVGFTWEILRRWPE